MNSYKDKTSSVKIIYHNGEIYSVERLKKSDKVLWDGLKQLIPFYEDELTDVFKSTKTNPTKAKIALFCIGYRAWTLKTTGNEIEYKPTKAESGMIKGFELNQDLLRTFLLTEFWTKEKTIANYVKHYNEIKRISAAKGKGAVGTGSETLGDAFRRRYSK